MVTTPLFFSEGRIELTGTEEQLSDFFKARESINDMLFPRLLSYEKTLKLALDLGLSVKKAK